MYHIVFFRPIQQYWAQSGGNNMTCNFPIVRSGQNWDKCCGETTIWSSNSDLWCELQTSARKPFYVVIIQVSEEFYIRISICAKTSSVCLYIIFNGIISSTGLPLCRNFAVSFSYFCTAAHGSINELTRLFAAQSDLECSVGWFLRWR